MANNVKYNNLRISILKEDIIRFEYVPSMNFTNSETLFTAKKRLANASIELGMGERIWFNYQDLVFVFDYVRPLDTLEVYQNDKRIYKYRGLSNSGELPLPNKTPYIFPLMDAPRLIIPSEGYDETSEYIYEKDTRDLFLCIARGEYKKLRKQYMSLTGSNDLLRIKNFGLFNSRYYAWNDKGAKEMIEKYHLHHIPLDNMVLDTDWRDSSKASKFGTGYDINKKLFPDLAAFYRYAHNHNVEIMMNDHPSPVNKKATVLDKEEIVFRKENLTKFLIMGLDTWWYDRNWMVRLGSISKRIPVESLGRYLYHDITRQFYQGMVLDPEVYTRPVTSSNITEIRNGDYLGLLDSRSHIYPFQWSGDISSDFGSITNEVVNMIKCANNMLAYYSSDIGGHISNPNRQEFVRWYQYGAFSPILRPHCTNSVIRFREPWVFGEKTFNIVKEYIYMRYRLLNVIYTNAYKHYLEGNAIFRPLYLNYPDDKKVYKEKTSYMLGDNILISPIGGNKTKLFKLSDYKGKVSASFYDNKELKGKAILVKKLDEINFNLLDNEKLYEELPAYNYSARYRFKIHFKEDIDFYLASDDGVRVYIDGKRVLNDWKEHAPLMNYVASIKKGEHKIVIEYFQALGGAALKLYYSRSVKNKKTKIYLPKGEWYNLSHRNVYQGNRYIKEKYDLDEMPLFVKAGAILPLYKDVANISKMSLKNIVYDYYPSKDEIVEDYFYEDDGITTGYKVGINRINRYMSEFRGDHYLITLYKSENNLDDKLDARNVMFKMHVRDKEKVYKVTVNDDPIRIKRHDHNKKIYPFSTSEWARDSKTMTFKFRQDIKKNYYIKIYVK